MENILWLFVVLCFLYVFFFLLCILLIFFIFPICQCFTLCLDLYNHKSGDTYIPKSIANMFLIKYNHMCALHTQIHTHTHTSDSFFFWSGCGISHSNLISDDIKQEEQPCSSSSRCIYTDFSHIFIGHKKKTTTNDWENCIKNFVVLAFIREVCASKMLLMKHMCTTTTTTRRIAENYFSLHIVIKKFLVPEYTNDDKFPGWQWWWYGSDDNTNNRWP